MISAMATAYAIHHVVLPPKLPQQDDRKTEHEVVLLENVIQALESLRDHVKDEHVGSIAAAIATVKNLRTCRDHHGNNSEVQLREVLTKVTNGTTEEWFEMIPLWSNLAETSRHVSIWAVRLKHISEVQNAHF